RQSGRVELLRVVALVEDVLNSFLGAREESVLRPPSLDIDPAVIALADFGFVQALRVPPLVRNVEAFPVKVRVLATIAWARLSTLPADAAVLGRILSVGRAVDGPAGLTEVDACGLSVRQIQFSRVHLVPLPVLGFPLRCRWSGHTRTT